MVCHFVLNPQHKPLLHFLHRLLDILSLLVRAGLGVVPDDLTVLDQEALAASHAIGLLHDLESLNHFCVRVGDQCEWEGEFITESLLRCDRIMAHADDLRAELCEIAVRITQRAALLRAARSICLRVEIDDHEWIRFVDLRELNGLPFLINAVCIGSSIGSDFSACAGKGKARDKKCRDECWDEFHCAHITRYCSPSFKFSVSSFPQLP